jgi:hypothetical protein
MRLTWWRKHADTAPEQLAEIKELCASVAARVKAGGHSVEAFTKHEHDVPNDVENRVRALRIYDRLLAHHESGEGAEPDVKGLLWNFLSQMGYTPTGDLFDCITDGDVVEVYTHGATQLFRSLNFFDLASISVEDLIFMNWKRDTKRDLTIYLTLLGVAVRFAMGQVHHTYDLRSLPKHVVTERLGNKHLIEGNIKWLSPLKKDGKCEAIVVISRGRVIGRA